jgi:hypothetical protein
MSAPVVQPVPAVDLPLDEYGQPLVSYSGTGTLTRDDGWSTELTFNAAQFPDGRIVVLGHHPRDEEFIWFGGGDEPEPTSFNGVTLEGWTLTSGGQARSTNYLPKMTIEGSYAATRLNQLECSRGSSLPVTDHRFGLVNFDFEGTHRIKIERSSGEHYTIGLPVPLKVGGRVVNAMIVAVEDADHLHRRVMTHKSAEVLAELVVPKTEGIDGADLVQAVNDLGVALSVARGTKVVWIYRHDWSGSQIVHTTHRATIVKAYSPWAPLRGNHEHRAATAAFVLSGATALTTSAVLKADRSVVDAYLDAKVEHDFLETRAAKLALAIEKLKHTFLRSGVADVGEFVVPAATFQPLVPKIVDAIRPILEQAGIEAEKANLIASVAKVGGLNRAGFGGIVKALCRHAGLKVSSKEMKLFGLCRDYLVHTGQFYCQGGTAEEWAKDAPAASPLGEYCFMISFLDRLFLKLFGYSGEYFDWRDFPHDQKKTRTLP